jgi:hypothetical protein
MAASMGSECIEFVEEEFHNDKKLKILALEIKRSGISD